MSEVYKKLLKRREWRLGWAERADMGFSLPERKDPRNAQAAQLIEFARLGKLFLSGLTHLNFGGREGTRTPDFLVANEARNLIRRGAAAT